MPAGLHVGASVTLRYSCYGARAGAVVKIVDTVPMPAGRDWFAIEPAPGAPTCVVPPEQLSPADGVPTDGPAAQQLQLGGLEMDTLERPTVDPSGSPDYHTPNTLQIIAVPVGAVVSHPRNPRKTFDEKALQELAVDISIRGILQPLVVRTLPEGAFHVAPAPLGGYILVRPGSLQPGRCFDTAEEAEAALPTYELVAGERRWRAAQIRLPALADDQGTVLRPEWPGLDTVPVIVRDDLSAADVLACMMSENLQRADLNPMEIAAGFKAMQDAGLRQTDIAKRLGISQPSVANALSLLRLPESVQQLITEGRLSASHGRVLVRWAMHPDYCTLVATYYADRNISVSQLEAAGNFPLRYEASNANILAWLGSGTPFDWQEICLKACPHQAFMRDGEHSGACFHLPCYREKCKEAQAAQAEDARRVQEQIRQAAAARQAPATDSSGPSDTPDPAGDAPAEESPLLHLEQLDPKVGIVPGRYTPGVANTALPAACRKEQCEHYIEGLYNGKPAHACFDPACFARLHKQAAAAARQQREADASLLADRARIATNRAAADPAALPVLLAPLVLRVMEQTAAATLRTVLAKMQLPWDVTLFTANSYDRPATPAELLDLLATQSVKDLLLIARLCIIETEQTRAASEHEYDRRACRTIAWWSGTPNQADAEELLRHYQNRDPKRRAADDSLRASAGLPLLGPSDDAAAAPAAPDPDPSLLLAEPELSYICAACGASIPEEHVEAFHTAREYGTDDVLWDEDESNGLHLPTGLALDVDGSLYCIECAEAVVPDLWAQRAVALLPGEVAPPKAAGDEEGLVGFATCSRCGVRTDTLDREAEEEQAPVAPSQVTPAYCAFCLQEIPAATVAAWERRTDAEKTLLHQEALVPTVSGAVHARTGKWYCATCAENRRICRECGRSAADTPALENPSHWASVEVCSACANFAGGGGEEE